MEIFERIASVLSGTSGKKEKEELAAWRRENPANEEEFCKLKSVWDAAAPLFRPDTDQAWNKVSACIFQQKSPSVVPFYRTPWAIAATVALFAVAAGLLLLNRPESGSVAESKLIVLETKEQEKNTLTLSDGSRIWLNENSKLFYPAEFSTSSREIKLEGEAYFEVAEMPDKPFTVEAGAGKIQVLGTSFNLEAKEQVKVQVTGGRVLFSASETDKSLTLTAGDAAALTGKTLTMENQDPNFLSWKTGEFTFEDHRLKEVFHILENYYGVRIKAATPQIARCRLFARFKEQPLEEILKVLSLTLNLAYEYEPGQAEVVFLPAAQGQSCSPAGQ